MKGYLKIISLSIFITFCTNSCTENSSKTEGSPNSLELINGTYEFQIEQREKIEIPSTNKGVYCAIDDITGGQTLLKIYDSSKVYLQKSISEGVTFEFDFGSANYIITCDKLINVLIGTDVGIFRITTSQAATNETIQTNSVQDSIAQLLELVRSSDLLFIRNGSEHKANEAANHLENKVNQAGANVKSVADFIENIASQSSITGEAYLIKLPDGATLNARDWFYAQITKIE